MDANKQDIHFESESVNLYKVAPVTVPTQSRVYGHPESLCSILISEMIRLIFFLIGLTSTSVLQAQNWSPTGASWHYNQIVLFQGETDETWWNDGTVTIESKDGQKVTKKFVGECGC